MKKKNWLAFVRHQQWKEKPRMSRWMCTHGRWSSSEVERGAGETSGVNGNFSFFLLAVTFLTKWTRAPKRAKKWEKKIFIMSRSFSEDEDLERSDFAVLLCRHVNTRSVDCPSQSFNAIGVFGCFHFSAMTCLFCFNRFAIFFWPTFTLKGCCEPNKEFGLSVRRAIESCAISFISFLRIFNKSTLYKIN